MTFKEEFNALNFKILAFAEARQNPKSEVAMLESTYNTIIVDLQRILPDVYLNYWLDGTFTGDILNAMDLCKSTSFIEYTLETMIADVIKQKFSYNLLETHGKCCAFLFIQTDHTKVDRNYKVY